MHRLRFASLFAALCPFLLISLSAGAANNDVCMRQLSDRIQDEFDQKRWTFSGLMGVTPEQLMPKLGTYSGIRFRMNNDDRSAVQSYTEYPGYEFYLITGTSDYSVSFMDVAVVQVDGCLTVERKPVYFE